MTAATAPRPLLGVRHGRRTGVIAGALCAVVLALGGCGSGGTPPTTTTAAMATADVGRAYDTLFDFADTSVSAKTAVIQDGATLRAALTQALSSSLAKSATGARVDDVTLLDGGACRSLPLPSPCAKVTYDLLGANAQPLFPTPSTGYALSVGGHWLVAKSTICSLLGLFYSASGRSGTPPGC